MRLILKKVKKFKGIMHSRLLRSIFMIIVISTVGTTTGALFDCHVTTAKNGIQSVLHDTGSFFKNFADWDTYTTVVATFPLYVASRMVDKRIHSYFYDDVRHKNINSIPTALCTFTDKWAIQTIAGCNVGFLLFSNNERLRQTSKLFLIGLPFLVWTTDIFKHFCSGEFSLRPLHEHFCKDHKRTRRGFPSTHAADFAFVTALFSMQFGPRAGVPLGVLGGLVVYSFINDNRHYLSQIVAGSGLGVIFALAANKVVNKNLSCNLQLHIDVMDNGSPAVGLSYAF